MSSRSVAVSALVLCCLAFDATARVITYDGFANTTGLVFRGDASSQSTNEGVAARLTPALGAKAGSVMLGAAVGTAWFRTHFTFRLTDSTGTVNSGCNTGAGGDGLAFVMQRDLASVGGSGLAMGYGGIPDSVGVEWDTFCNEALSDPDSNHIGIDLGGIVDHGTGSSFTTGIEPDFDDGNVWHAWIDYDGVTLEVRTNQTGVRPPDADLARPLDLPAVVSGDTAFVGFTAGTGGVSTKHDVLSWEYEDDARRLAGTRLSVKQRKSGTQRLLVVAKDDGVTSDAAISACQSDGRLVLLPEGRAPRELPLDSSSWRAITKKKPARGCRFRSRDVVAKVIVKTGKLLKIVAKGTDLGIPLDADPTPVRIELRHDGVRHCVNFGGDVSFTPNKKLVAKRADRADRCPVVTTTSTTSTTTTLPQGDFFNDCINVSGLCDPREICVSYAASGIGVCALPCTATTECPAPIVETAPVECLVPTDFPSVCMQTCTSGANCPVGMVCGVGICYFRVPL